MREICLEGSAAGRRDHDRFASRARALLISAGAFALILAQSASVSAGKADNRGLWVPNANGDTIVEFTPVLRAASGSPVPAATLNSAVLDFPASVAFDPSGNMWVANAGAPSLVEFTAIQLLELGNTSDPVPAVTVTSSDFNNPLADFDHSGNLWVSDFDNNEIFEFSKKQLKTGGDLTPAITITSPALDGARYLAFDHKGNLWISNSNSSQIEEFAKKKIAMSGALTPAVIISNDGSGSLSGCTGIAFDHNHNLWVANESNDSVVEFAAASLKASGSPAPAVTIGSTSSSLATPVGLGFDDKHNLWVSNYVGDTVVEYLPSQITSSGTPTPTVKLSRTSDSLVGPEQFSFGD